MRRLSDGSYVTTLQEKTSKVDGNGKTYPQFSTYFPVKKTRSLGWKGKMELHLTYTAWKDKSGNKHWGWIVEPYGRKCLGCGAFNSREADYCIECGAPRAMPNPAAQRTSVSPVARAGVAVVSR